MPFQHVNTGYFDPSIIAVHGLGGHWRNTWTSIGNKRIWLEDFLPTQLKDAGVKARVMSYGYDSGTAFTKAVTDIDDTAGMLLNRLEGDRQSSQEKARPILFIAHSLGGIIVKKVRVFSRFYEWPQILNNSKAIILAHGEPSYYRSMIEHVRALVFLGVPHGGADPAYWALFAARILQFGQLGFRTNPAYVSALQRNSQTLTDISERFKKLATHLSIRTFFETERMGNQLVRFSAVVVFPLATEHR